MEKQELRDLASQLLTDMTQMMGFDATAEIVDDAEGDNFKLSVKCENASRLIGRRGQSLEALELLLNRMLRKHSEEIPWVHLDIDGYTSNEHEGDKHSGGKGGEHHDTELWERFAGIAADAAKEVKYWKKAKRLGPYNPAERRVIHTIIKDMPGLTTESEAAPLFGERMKYVYIKPAEDNQ